MIEPDPRIAKLKGGAKQTAIRNRSRVHQLTRAKERAYGKGHAMRVPPSIAKFRRAKRAEHANREREPIDQDAAKEARRKARNRRRKQKQRRKRAARVWPPEGVKPL